MEAQKLARWQWIFLTVFSFCGALALSMNFAMPDLPAEQKVNSLTEIIWNIRNSLEGTSVNSTLLFGSLMGLGILVHRTREREALGPSRILLPISFLIALMWLMGAGFSINNTLEALILSPGQIVKSVCYVAGSTYLLYVLGQILFCFLERQRTVSQRTEGRLATVYQNHPFLVPFFAVLLFWSPHLIIAYPGYMCYDAWGQLTEFYGKTRFSTHHPPVHTVILGLFSQLGLKIGSTNAGLYISIIFQSLIAASVFAYTLFLMERWGTPRWLKAISFSIIVLVPYYTDYVGVEIKDTPFAICFLLFIIELICIVEQGEIFFKNRRHIFCLSISIMGTLIFRNNGKYVLYPTILVLLGYFLLVRRINKRGCFIKAAMCLLAPVVIANLLSAVIMGYYDAEKGSIREALSLPFQQTARYVQEHGNEVTEEEAEIIRAVLDYDHLAERYNPRISDPVKGAYQEEASKKELLRYFITWCKMFFKHPETYIKATMNQNYYLLYPFVENDDEHDVIYTETLPEEASKYIESINGELGISEVECLQNYKLILRGIYKSCFSLPIIGMFSHPAPYCILLIFLIVFAIHKRFSRLIVILFPLVLSAIVVVLAPVIQGHPRYAFPIIYTMPITMAYYMHLKESAMMVKGNLDFKESNDIE